MLMFEKGGVNVIEPRNGEDLDWGRAAEAIRDGVGSALNARNVAFLLGSGCSSLVIDGEQRGIDTMAPLAEHFLGAIGQDDAIYPTAEETSELRRILGIDLSRQEFSRNLERLLEVLFSFQFSAAHSDQEGLVATRKILASLIRKTKVFIADRCTNTPFNDGDPSVISLYQSFYQKLLFRDRGLPRPWVFTTNYDQLNEIALDRIGAHYCNGFSGTVERRFNPTTYRYALADQLDLSNQKWAAVDSFVYLCKLHGSVNWIEEPGSLFPVRELDASLAAAHERVMIYPSPLKQNASFGSPYADLFREFQGRIVQEQSVLFVMGYSFGDEHINNIIFRALTIPNFRLVAFVPPDADGVVASLRGLKDPRVWLIGGDGPQAETYAHFFDTIVEYFLPELPAENVDSAIRRVLSELVREGQDEEGGLDGGH